MKEVHSVLTVLCFLCVFSFADEPSGAMTKGVLLSDYLPALEKYGKGTPLLNQQSEGNLAGSTEAVGWRIGDGLLVVEHTVGAGIIKNISYLIPDGKDGHKTVLKVKEIDLAKGELTIVLPSSQSQEGTTRSNVAPNKKSASE